MIGWDLLEFELRRLPYVRYVGFGDRDDLLVVQIVASPGADADVLRRDAERVCRGHLDREFVLELEGSASSGRVRLLDARTLRIARRGGDGPDEDSEIEVQLAFGQRQTVGRATGDDPTAAAAATFQALQQFGASVPFAVEAAAHFEHEVGRGVMIVLGSGEDVRRYGVASGPDVVVAAVRATLDALNRYLSTQMFTPATSS